MPLSQVCILDCDSPSYPPDNYERFQCLCKLCIKDLIESGHSLVEIQQAVQELANA